MPAYVFDEEQKDFIKQSVNAIINQTYKDWELIIVDDGSPLKFKVPKDDRVSYYRVEHGGIAKTRNYGIKQMTGDVYIPFDIDDVSEPIMLAEIKKALKHGDVVYWDYWHCSPSLKNKRLVKAEPFDFKRLQEEQYIAGYVAVKKEKLVPYRDKYISHDDWVFIVDLYRNGAKFTRINKLLHNYRLTPLSTSIRTIETGEDEFRLDLIRKDIL